MMSMENKFISGQNLLIAGLAAFLMREPEAEMRTFQSQQDSEYLRAAVALGYVKILQSGDSIRAVVADIGSEYDVNVPGSCYGASLRAHYYPFTDFAQIEKYKKVLQQYIQDHDPQLPVDEDLLKRLTQYGEFAPT